MKAGKRVSVIIPALNEEKGIVQVLGDLPVWIDDVVVVDNGSTDRTAVVASELGARVIEEPKRGYGAACLRGLSAIGDDADVVLFLDADYSDRADMAGDIVGPVARGEADLVIGVRTPDQQEPGALTPQQRFGNALACALIRMVWRVEMTDLGPFRAVSRDVLHRLRMRDRGFGWTVEMQVKAARNHFRIVEVPVPYRRRTGQSKISGTLSGSIQAGAKILSVIGRAALEDAISRSFRRPASLP